MEKSVLFIFVVLAFVAYNQAGPISESSKRKLSDDKERSRLSDQLTRERRRVDYYDWEQFLPKCTECNVLSIGNGYKNKNYVTFNGPMPKDWRLSK